MTAPRKLGEKILELREQGLTYREIQSELNCSKGTIAYHLGEGQKLKYKDNSQKARTARYKKYYELKDNPCTDCGLSFPPFLMHWDHMGELEKEGTIAHMMTNNSWQDVLDEIAKCELVCGNCHGLRTIKRAIEVGTASQLMIEYYNRYINGV